jgi:hypothetical protein
MKTPPYQAMQPTAGRSTCLASIYENITPVFHSRSRQPRLILVSLELINRLQQFVFYANPHCATRLSGSLQRMVRPHCFTLLRCGRVCGISRRRILFKLWQRRIHLVPRVRV